MSKLFGDINSIKVGIAPGEHVVHIITGEADNSQVLYSDVSKEANDIATSEITKKQVYSSISNKNTAVDFLNIVRTVDKEYDADLSGDEKYKGMLESIHAYLVEGSRKKQQEAAEKMLKNVDKYIAKYSKTEDDNHKSRVAFAKSIRERFEKSMNGNLVIDGNTEKLQSMVKAENIDNPSFSGISGFFSRWRKRKDRPLFPHEPDPTDIVQGIGLEDCYMQASLLKIAQTHPEKIKNAMKDNGDGTVTVRFYENNVNPETNESQRQPVYIRVEKSESKILGVGGASYATGSLWVQMMEKAYAKYNDRQLIKGGSAPKGLAGINRGNAYNFLNAFEEKDDYAFEFTSSYGEDLFQLSDINSDKELSEAQNAYCSKLFDFLKNHKDETIIVGSNFLESSKNNKIKELGIRTGHAYAIMDTFEKDGERYVQVRDPYGVFSSKYENGKLKNSGDVVTNYFNGGSDTLGTFNLKIKDFATIFSNITGIKEELKAEFVEIKNECDNIRYKNNKKMEELRKNEEAEAEQKNGKIDKFEDDISNKWAIIETVENHSEKELSEKESSDKISSEKESLMPKDSDDFVDLEQEIMPADKPPKLKTGKYDVIQNAMSFYYKRLTSVQSKYNNSEAFKKMRDAVKELSEINVGDDIQSSDKYTLYRNKLNSIKTLINGYIIYKNGKYSTTSQNKLEVSLELNKYIDDKLKYMSKNQKDYCTADKNEKANRVGELLSDKELKKEEDNVLNKFGPEFVNKLESTILKQSKTKFSTKKTGSPEVDNHIK